MPGHGRPHLSRHPRPDSPASGAGRLAGLDGPALVYGVAAVVLVFWCVNPTAFIAEDAYFYLVSARRFAHGDGQTFSGVFSSNGFHPLWLYILYGWAKLCELVDPEALRSARFVVPPAAACLLVGVRALLALARRLRLSPSLVAGVPLVYVGTLGILASEGHALFAAASIFLLRWSSDRGLATDRAAIVTGACGGLVVLARLDALFWFLAVVGWVFVFRPVSGARRRIVLCGIAGAMVVLPYLVGNVVFFGGLVPISGWMKSSFPRLRTVVASGSVLGAFRGYNNLFGHAPIVLALLSYRAWARLRNVVAPLLVGCLAHDVYTSLFGSYSEWYWYYVLNVLLAALCLACLAARLLPRWVVTLTAAGVALAGMGGLIALRRTSYESSARAFPPTRFLNDRHVRGETVLVGDTPGYIAFYSEADVLAADFLTANRRVFDAISREENPLRALFRACAAAGHPISYVIWDGNRWLGASPDWRTLRLYHPKNGHDGEPFGELPMPRPVLVSPHTVVWDVRGLAPGG